MGDTVFHFGDWLVRRDTNSLEQGSVRRQMEPRAMEVLAALCEQAGAVLSADQLLQRCWGTTDYSDNPVHKTIAQLRRLLDDSAGAPAYIETIRKRGYRTVAPVTRAGPDAERGSWQDGSPFRGLRAFDAAHARVFFGRADALAALTAALVRQRENRRDLVLLLGPSGSGKTSLVRAGLVPALAGGDPMAVKSSAELDLGDVAEGQLLAGLASAMLDWQLDAQPLFPGHSAFSLGACLASDGRAVVAGLPAALRERAAAPNAQLFLFLDRFEAVFAHAHVAAAQREQLIATIDALARSGSVIVVLACRNDFYPQLAAHPLLLEGKKTGGHVDLQPPTPHEIAQIIRLPARAANLSFGIDPRTQARLDDTLCLAAGALADALPLLQYTLEELYRLRSADDELEVAAYQHFGGLEGAIGVRAEEAFAALTEQQRAALPRVLSLLVTVSPDGNTATGRRAPWAALHAHAERELVNALVEARLFVSELVGAEAGFGLAHEALLRCWSRVSDWIAAHGDSLRARARVAQMAGRWTAAGRPGDLLLPDGQQLAEALALTVTPGMFLSAEELDLVQASRRKSRWRGRGRAAALGLMVVLALLAGLFGMRASLAGQVAQQKRIQAEGLMGFMLGDFADKLRPLGRLDLLDRVSAQALSYLAGPAEGETASLKHRAKALAVLGEVRIARGDPDGASVALLAGKAILERQLELDSGDTELLKALGANAFWLGQISLDKSEWDLAHAYFSRYRDYADRLGKLAPVDIDTWIEQSYAQNSLGTLALRRGDPRAAAAAFLASIALKQKALAQRKQDPMLAADLADSMSWAGSSAEASGDLEEARGWYEAELRLVGPLRAAAPGNLLWTKKVSMALHHRATIALARGQSGAALADYRAANGLLKEVLRAEPANLSWQSNLMLGQLAVLRIEAAQGVTPAILKALAELRQRSAALAARAPANTDWAKLQALALYRHAAALFKAGRGPCRGCRGAPAATLCSQQWRCAYPPHPWRCAVAAGGIAG